MWWLGSEKPIKIKKEEGRPKNRFMVYNNWIQKGLEQIGFFPLKGVAKKEAERWVQKSILIILADTKILYLIRKHARWKPPEEVKGKFLFRALLGGLFFSNSPLTSKGLTVKTSLTNSTGEG